MSSKKTFFDSNPSYGEPSHYFPAGEGSRLVRRWRNVRRPGAAARCASAFDDALPIMSASKVTGILGTEYMHSGSSWASCSAQSPSLPYEEGWRAQSAGVALWDTLQVCTRPGSLDASITEEVANDLPALFAEDPNITHAFFNGGKAQRSFRRHVLPALREDPHVERLL